MQALSVPKPPERIAAPRYDVEMLVANIVQHFLEMQDRTGISASHDTLLLAILVPIDRMSVNLFIQQFDIAGLHIENGMETGIGCPKFTYQDLHLSPHTVRLRNSCE